MKKAHTSPVPGKLLVWWRKRSNSCDNSQPLEGSPAYGRNLHKLKPDTSPWPRFWLLFPLIHFSAPPSNLLIKAQSFPPWQASADPCKRGKWEPRLDEISDRGFTLLISGKVYKDPCPQRTWELWDQGKPDLETSDSLGCVDFLIFSSTMEGEGCYPDRFIPWGLDGGKDKRYNTGSLTPSLWPPSL